MDVVSKRRRRDASKTLFVSKKGGCVSERQCHDIIGVLQVLIQKA
jgi:hypothetical protein